MADPTNYPERITVDQSGTVVRPTEACIDPVKYVRADLYAALEAERDRANQALLKMSAEYSALEAELDERLTEALEGSK